jgi:uncharacterized BrkB/YihY/UPF0761 family membrane protein
MTLTDPQERAFASPPPPPRTAIVLVVLALVALVISWIGAYAVTNALVAADVLAPWSPGDDPRPHRMGILFICLLALLAAAALMFRWVSARQLRRLDALADAEDEPLSQDS